MSITQNPTIDQTERDVFVYYLTGGSAVFGCVGDPEGLIAANRNSLAISNNGNVYSKTTDGVATGWQIVGGGGGGTGTVTSVGLTVPGVIFETPVVGSPVTTAGTLALALATQSANRFLGGPASGIAATPTFRTLTNADIGLAASPPAGGIQFNDGANSFIAESDFLFDAATGTLQIGVAASRSGRIQLRSLVSGSTTFTVDTPSSAHVITMPNALPSTNDLLRAAAVSGSNITWGYVAPSALGFPTINATDGVLPYRSSSVAFSDSPIVRNGANDVSIGNSGAFAGLQITGAAAGSGVTVAALSSGATEGILLQTKGSGGARLSSVLNSNYWTYNRNDSAGSTYAAIGRSTDSGFKVDSAGNYRFSATNGNALAVSDCGFSRLGTNAVRVDNGSTGAGKFAVGSSTASTANQFLVDSQGTTVVAGFFSMPGSSTVPTIKAETSAVQSFAFNPSGKLIGGCNIPTTNQQFSAIGNAKSDVSTIGNIGTGIDNLLSFAIQANVLNNNGDYAEFDAFGEFENNANNKQLTVKLGATTIFTTGALPFGAAALANWRINAKIIRTAASGQKCIVTFWSNDGTTKFLQAYTTSGESLTSNLTVQFTGEATATNDITQVYLESKLCVALTS